MNRLAVYEEGDAWRIDKFRRCWAIFGLVLFAVTWRLWTPQSVYPQIPLLELFVEWPAWMDWLGLAGVAASLLVVMIAKRPKGYQTALLLFAAAVSTLLMLDQHRLQPWAYQFVVLALSMACCRPQRALSLMRGLAISIYIYSAVSKFDYQFLHTLGREFLSRLVGYVGLHSENWPESVELVLVGSMPVGELLVGLGLLFPRTRRMAVVFAIILHVSLLLILGPWGLGHKAGVLIWNLFFIFQVCLLFLTRRETTQPADVAEGSEISADKRSGQRTDRWLAQLAEIGTTSIVCFVLFLPITAAFGLCDHWPAWELYSPRNSRAHVYIHASARERLPPELQEHLAAAKGDDPWRRLHSEQWSLDELDAPIYPQDRFQIGVALAIAQRYQLNRSIRVEWQSASSRWTGARSEQVMAGTEQIRIAAERFRLNTLARSLVSAEK